MGRVAWKWNFKDRNYEEYKLPIGASMFEKDMDNKVQCANCSITLLYGDSFTSRRIHGVGGLAYGVCQECYSKELKLELEFIKGDKNE